MQHFCIDGILYNDKARILIQLSSYFHFLESIDISNICFVFSFRDQLRKELFTLQVYVMVKYIQWMNYPYPKPCFCHFQLGQLTSENLSLPEPRVPDNPTFKFTTLPDPTRS